MISRRHTQSTMYGAVLCDASSYTIVIIAYDPALSLFNVHACQTMFADHGEFGAHFFINHTRFFKSIVAFFTQNNYHNHKIALLCKNPFITATPHPLIPSLFQNEYALTYPLLLQCSIIPPRYDFTITLLTATDAAYQTAIAFTQHSYDEYTIDRLCAKKSGTDFIPAEQYYNVIAACGAYFMENE